jgi:hypothetical protein
MHCTQVGSREYVLDRLVSQEARWGTWRTSGGITGSDKAPFLPWQIPGGAGDSASP